MKGSNKMDDLISRQDAIDALEEQLDYLERLDEDENPTAEDKWYGVNWARNTIADLPPAQKKGEWIAREDMDFLDENKVVHKHFQCNHCGLIHDFIDGHTSQYNFCPQCGYRLER